MRQRPPFCLPPPGQFSKKKRAVCSRTREHLALVSEIYMAKYGKSLEEEISSETSGDYKQFLTYLAVGKAKADARAIRRAIEGLGTNDDLLITVCCCLTNDELLAAKQEYKALYGVPAEVDVANDTSGDYKDLLIERLRCVRSEDAAIDDRTCEEMAELLFQTGENTWGTDEKVFIDVFTKLSPGQLQSVSSVYETKSDGKTLEEAIRNETSWNLCEALLALMQDRIPLLAEILKKATVDKIGTDEELVYIYHICPCRPCSSHPVKPNASTPTGIIRPWFEFEGRCEPNRGFF